MPDGPDGPYGPYGPYDPPPRNPKKGGGDPCPPPLIYNSDGQCVKSGQGACPPGQTPGPRGDCRYSGDYPCPSGLCKDVNSGACRTPGGNEKVNETDDIERSTGGGRGYCRQRDGGGGGGAGAGGARAGGGAGAGGGFGIQSPSGTFNKLSGMFDSQTKSMWDELMPIIQGKNSTYTPEIMGMLEGRAKLDAEGMAASQRAAMSDEAIGRGMGRSGGVTRASRDIGQEAVRSYTQTVTGLRVKKVEKDFADKMQALERATVLLDKQQNYIMGLDATAAQREQAIANIALGYARISAEQAMLRERLANDLKIAQLGNLNDILRGLPA